METLRTAGLIAGAMLLSCGAALAGDYDWDDIWAPYVQRTDTATMSSGNAQNLNAATQMITPWPRYVHDRRIPGNGARMVGAIERYRGQRAPGAAAPPVHGSAMPAASSGAASLAIEAATQAGKLAQ